LGVTLVVSVWLVLGPIVRGRAVRALARRGLDVTIGRVWVGFFSVRLVDVELRSRGSGWLRARLPIVTISVGPLLGPSSVSASHGEIDLCGAPEDVTRKLRDVMGDDGSAAKPTGEGRLEIRASDLAVRWIDAGSDAAALEVDRAFVTRPRSGDGQLGAETLRWRRPGVTVVANGTTALFARTEHGIVLREVRSGVVDLALSLERLAPPPTATDDAAAPPSRGARLRDLFAIALASAKDHVADPAHAQISGLKLLVAHGDQKLNLGPGSLSVVSGTKGVEVDLLPGPVGQGSSPLKLHAAVPREAGNIDVRVEGGPVTLAALGVHENDFGLVDVARATLAIRSTVTLSPDGRTLSFGGDGRFSSLSIAQAKLAQGPVRGIELAFRAAGALETDGSRMRIDDGEIDLGGIRLTAAGAIDRGPDAVRLEGRVGVPLSDCQRMFESIPTALVPKLIGLKLAGSFSLDSALKLDTRKPEDIALEWHMVNRCRIVEAPADIRAARFRGPFQRTVYGEKDQKVEVVGGPGTADWVPLSAISPYLEAAVTTTEDGGFRAHGGFDQGAIRSSIRDNLRAGKFLRGASTISMQLAKNLYLDRGKSLSRKLQEAILTLYLEQEMTKDEILELYLNVVELGPMVYGVGQAAQYYFNTTPYDLSLGQALFLSSILPAPKRSYFGADDQLAKGWASYLYRLMKIMRNRNKITEQDLTEGLAEVITLHVARSPHNRGVAPATLWDGNVPWLPPDMAP
jgi:hypothetical protein